MRAFMMHVGYPGNIDLAYTVTKTVSLDQVARSLPDDAPEKHYFQTDPILRSKFPDGQFNCWGVPDGAQRIFNLVSPGDVVFFVPQVPKNDVTELGSGVEQYGVVEAICPHHSWAASRVLWPKTPDAKLFPHIFFFRTYVGQRPWFQFLKDINYKPNFDPRGKFLSITSVRFERYGGEQGYLRYLQQEAHFRPLEAR